MSMFETETYQGMDFNIKRFESFHPGDKAIMEFNSKVEKVCDGILPYKDFLSWIEDEIKTFDWTVIRKKDYPLDYSTNKIVNSSSSSIYTSSTNNFLSKSIYETKEMLSSGILPSPPPKIIVVNKGGNSTGVNSIEKVNKYPKRNLDINPIIVKKSNYYLVNNTYVYLPSTKSIVGKLENNKLVTMTNIPLSEIVSKLLM
jgi:hypothetical protein